MSEMSSRRELWRHRTYPVKFIPYLPEEYRFTDKLKLVVDYGDTEDVGACRDIVFTCAADGDNVGLDEFSNDDDFRNFLELCEMFVCKDPKSGTIMAIILVSLPVYVRTLDPCLAQIYVFRARDLRGDNLAYHSLIRLAERLLISLDMGYTQCMVCVASCCRPLMKELRSQGYLVVANIPLSVEMAKVGKIDNIILVKQLGMPDRKPRESDDVEKMLGSIFAGCLMQPISAIEFLQVPFLPQDYVFNGQYGLIFRNMDEQEAPLLYQMFRESVKEGQGYGLHEVATFDYFVTFVLSKSYCVFVEDRLNGRLISWIIISDSWYARSKTTGSFADCSFGITKNFQELGLGKTLISIIDGLCLELGYEIMLNDYFGSNHKMATINQKRKATILGIIPKGGYVEGYGWDDQVIVHVLLRERAKPFLMLAEESRKRTVCQLSKI